MLRISQRCEYATRALIELALRADHRPAKIADVAVVRSVPRKFLGAILAQHRQAGVVESARPYSAAIASRGRPDRSRSG